MAKVCPKSFTQQSMNLNDLRGVIEEEGGKWIIVEDGKPVFVIVPFRDYIKNSKKVNPTLPFEQKFAVDDGKVLMNMPRELAEEPLKIEDLPV